MFKSIPWATTNIITTSNFTSTTRPKNQFEKQKNILQEI